MVSRMESGERPSRATSANTDRSTAGGGRVAGQGGARRWRRRGGCTRPRCPARSAPGSARRRAAARTARWRLCPARTPCRRCRPTRGPIRASARVNASAGSAQPATTSQPNVDGTPPTRTGLNTWTGPRRYRVPAVAANRSARVLVVMTAPGQSRSSRPARRTCPCGAGRSPASWPPSMPNTRLPHWARPSRSAYAGGGRPTAAAGRSGRAGPGRRAGRRPAGTTGQPARPGRRTRGRGAAGTGSASAWRGPGWRASAQPDRLNRQNSAASHQDGQGVQVQVVKRRAAAQDRERVRRSCTWPSVLWRPGRPAPRRRRRGRCRPGARRRAASSPATPAGGVAVAVVARVRGTAASKCGLLGRVGAGPGGQLQAAQAVEHAARPRAGHGELVPSASSRTASASVSAVAAPDARPGPRPAPRAGRRPRRSSRRPRAGPAPGSGVAARMAGGHRPGGPEVHQRRERVQRPARPRRAAEPGPHAGVLVHAQDVAADHRDGPVGHQGQQDRRGHVHGHATAGWPGRWRSSS